MSGESCVSCGGPLLPGGAFCPGCGTKVAAVPAPLSSAAASTDDGERRQLTLLFYDLVGSTELATRADPEDLQVAIARFQAMCARTVRQVGGYAAKTMGDGGLAYFGYPVAHEDDPFRAVMAAQAILDELPELNRALRAELPGLPDDLRMRIGIHSGTVVMGEEGSDHGVGRLAIGEALNLAARLESAAPVDGIAVSEVTARRIQGVVDLTSEGPAELKGLAEPVEVFRVERIRPGQSRFTSARPLGPFIGRETEAARLVEAWSAAEGGRPTTVVIRGEAGLGKTRLHQHLRHQLTGTRHLWFELYGSPVMSQSAFHPIVAALHQLLGLEGLGAADQRERLVAALAAADLADPERVARLAHLLEISDTTEARPALAPDEQRAATIGAIGDWLLALAAAQPTVIVAEDLHWYDPSTREVLRALRARATDESLLVIATTRPEEGVDAEGDVVVEIEPLPLEDVSALVDRLTADLDIAPVVRAQIASRSDGVPLYAEELVHASLDGGGDADAVPETLRELMAARLDRLGPAREVLQLAALLGREFAREQLAALTDGGEVDDALDLLVEQSFIARRSAGERAVYLFRHALLQDAARDSMLRRRRAAEHRRIARVLAERFAGTPDGRPEIVGHHFAEGAEPLRAIEQFQAAAREAGRRGGLREAAAHLARCVELVGTVEDGPERHDLEVDLHLRLGSAVALTDGMMSERATEIHLHAVELCRRSDPPHRGYGHALDGVLQSRLSAGHFDEALDAGEELLRWAEASGDRGVELAAHAALCQVHFWPGRYVECRAHAARAWELYDPSAADERTSVGIDSGVTALAFGAVGAWALGDLAESVAMADRCLALAESVGDVYHLAFTGAYLSMHAVMLNEPERCERLARRAQELSSRHGFLPMEGLSTYTLGWARAELGHADGLEVARAGVDQLAGMGASIGGPGCMAVLAEMCAKAGEIDMGLGYALLGEAMAEESAQHFYTVEIHRSLALLHQATADAATDLATRDAAVAAAEASARTAVDLARAQQAPSLELRAAHPLVALLEQRGEHDEAVALLAEVVDRFPASAHGRDLDVARAALTRAGVEQR